MKSRKMKKKNYCDIKTFLYKATIYILVNNKRKGKIIYYIMLFNVVRNLISGAAKK